MHNQNPLIQLLIDVECAYWLLSRVTGDRWARFAATDPEVSKGITDALNGLRTALDAALAHPMADAIRVDLLWLLGSFYWGGDGKGLVRAVSDAALSGSVFTLPGGDRVVKVTEARLLLQSPGPVPVAEAAPVDEADVPIAYITLTEKAIEALTFVIGQSTARTRTYIAANLPCDRDALTGWINELKRYKLIKDLGTGKGLLATEKGRHWLDRHTTGQTTGQ
jgi:hypothetical protein